MTSYAAYDAALEWLAPFGPDLAWGFTSHAPMVVEALCVLDRGDAVLPWLDSYRKGLVERPRPDEALAPDRWREALGRPERWADWTALFEAELAGASWSEVLARWVPRLVPGLAAAAAHGVIRAGHAARALAASDTPLRRQELAAGLGYWAATYQPLPRTDAPIREATSALEALARVPRTVHTRPESRSIVGALQSLDDCPEFAPVFYDWAPESAGDPIGALTEAFARVFVANVRDTLGAIVFTHGITGAASLRALAPHLSPADAESALRFAWQTGAALVATYATEDPVGDVAPPPEDAKSLVDAAVANGDDHAIKLTEACLSEHARNGSAVFLAAAKRGIETLGR